ncbi:Txe/YoeB family addiction module toxin [Agrobacterium sp. LC34]|uniref:Putative mRNA interferase YoeB n=1 Tax=Rhizobium rhizogenes TaxID=359 RepID=A0A546XKL1_RHIRH|nr:MULTISPECIES: Txe/YoeB family addiction module toxin [Rhizobium/Agrobacterium group]KNY34903.1 addiction module protein [Agrobacterium sp. SUL3]KRA61007.1 addiction module protein [Rhizobium sp. Root651]MCD4662708.1 Txe/YoeB family addiction module toxin [Agrobacterium sp.]MDA5633851.1 Txe/YoeB family addiction module toxin [Agrobacterium sp. ST15.16.024]MDF1889366.1 Txe/YoeB family addiction module toxin [Rhizobium rhizogenes]
MKLVWSLSSWDDYEFWQRTDARMVEKINDLIRNAKRTPFSGLGKPEPLKGDMAGYWSRRITGEHRFVYRVSGSGSEQKLEIIQCRFHYQ